MKPYRRPNYRNIQVKRRGVTFTGYNILVVRSFVASLNTRGIAEQARERLIPSARKKRNKTRTALRSCRRSTSNPRRETINRFYASRVSHEGRGQVCIRAIYKLPDMVARKVPQRRPLCRWKSRTFLQRAHLDFAAHLLPALADSRGRLSDRLLSKLHENIIRPREKKWTTDIHFVLALKTKIKFPLFFTNDGYGSTFQSEL